MNKLFLLLVFTFSSLSLFAQIDIAEARTMSEGTTVTVRGIVTNGPELSIIRYMQDATGAIAVYPGAGSVGNFPNDVLRGAEVEVTGELKSFNGLLEIDPVSAYTVISTGNPSPAPLVGTPNDVNEANEAKLMTLNGITFDNAGGLFSVGTYDIEGPNGETTTIYVRSNHPLIGTLVPLATVNLTGICSEFNGSYQLLPRDPADLVIADAFYITESHSQSDITTNSFNVAWKTNEAGSSNLRYGTDPNNLTEINMSNNTADHSISVTGLEAGTFYFVEVYSEDGTTTANSTTKLFSTASNSTGEVKVYFNHKGDANFSTGSYPDGTSSPAMEASIIERIAAATSTIDVAMYNTNRTTIVDALVEAHNNGIQVRFIADDQTANLALQNPIPPFPVLKGNAGSPLMHNKFYIFDAESINDSWIIMGSTNMTSQNLGTDFNNMVHIQDQAIAKAYTIEFEEMWGTDGPTPGVFSVKFGENKENNTPHLFNVNGMTVESYFSPSDNTTIGIINAIESANTDVEFAILTFTNNELGNAILDAHNASGVEVRGIIDNINDQGSEFEYLQNNGVNVLTDNNTKSTHHKYALIDASNALSDPIVITGSHNWSAGAETRNDENTLLFHDEAIANIFLQEFEARWCEATGGTNCTFTSSNDVNIDGFSAVVFPNPAIDYTNIELQTETTKDVQILLWNANGQLLHASLQNNVNGTHSKRLSLNGFAAGSYFLSFVVDGKTMTRGLQIVK